MIIYYKDFFRQQIYNLPDNEFWSIVLIGYEWNSEPEQGIILKYNGNNYCLIDCYWWCVENFAEGVAGLFEELDKLYADVVEEFYRILQGDDVKFIDLGRLVFDVYMSKYKQEFVEKGYNQYFLIEEQYQE